ncbi:hypothetical protein [Catellatospora paridis]|uniref:hypothetical protein n=1 Tax=Catellatospora paridis TaxID=1617086 RepID=UPI0012D47F8C|nr:hypothetical protein [Catellatospora paridis]
MVRATPIPSITVTVDTYTEVFAEVDLKSATAADVIARTRQAAPVRAQRGAGSSRRVARERDLTLAS